MVWGGVPDRGCLRRCAAKLPVLQVEDGFLRSVGLGADLVDPVSWVVDHQGVYYDAIQPSDLEIRLATGQWTPSQQQRAALRQRLVKEAITKYNLQAEPWIRPAGQRRVVLVIGQVESDASIRYGAPGLRTNRALLAAVREAEPEAYLVYKPHPDVVAGLCRAGVGEDAAADLCDEAPPQVRSSSCSARSMSCMCSHRWLGLRRCSAALRFMLGLAVLCRLGPDA